MFSARDKTAEQMTDDIINIHIPTIEQSMKDGKLQVENIDVFCEQGVFNVDQTKRILEAGRRVGMMLNFHGEELHWLGSAEV